MGVEVVLDEAQRLDESLGVCAAENSRGTAPHQGSVFGSKCGTRKQELGILGPNSGYVSPPTSCKSVLRRTLLAEEAWTRRRATKMTADTRKITEEP